MIRYFYFVAVLLPNAITSFCKMTTMTIRNYNIAGVLPYLIPVDVIMVHFSIYARPCVHKMTCANQTNSGFEMSRSFYRISPKMDENGEELVNRSFFLKLSLLKLYRTQRKHRDESNLVQAFIFNLNF